MPALVILAWIIVTASPAQRVRAEEAAAEKAYSYAIVVSEATFADREWKPVVEKLIEKHRGSVIRYGEQPGEVLPKLREMFPRYSCFVARPEEAGVFTLQIKPNLGDRSFEPVNTNGSQRGHRPIVAFLPRRIGSAEVLKGDDLNPTITDDFVLVPLPKRCDPQRDYKVVFRANSP